MEAVHMNYDSLNRVVITVDCTEQNDSGSSVYSITRRGSEGGKMDSWVRQCR